MKSTLKLLLIFALFSSFFGTHLSTFNVDKAVAAQETCTFTLTPGVISNNKQSFDIDITNEYFPVTPPSAHQKYVIVFKDVSDNKVYKPKNIPTPDGEQQKITLKGTDDFDPDLPNDRLFEVIVDLQITTLGTPNIINCGTTTLNIGDSGDSITECNLSLSVTDTNSGKSVVVKLNNISTGTLYAVVIINKSNVSNSQRFNYTPTVEPNYVVPFAINLSDPGNYKFFLFASPEGGHNIESAAADIAQGGVPGAVLGGYSIPNDMLCVPQNGANGGIIAEPDTDGGEPVDPTEVPGLKSGEQPDNILVASGVAGSFLSFGIGIGGGIAFLLMIFGAYRLMFAAGNPESIQQGQQIITAAIAGLLVIVFASFILRFIGFTIFGLGP